MERMEKNECISEFFVWSTTFPTDFDIFIPSFVHIPWAKISLESDIPVDIRNVGQYMAWKWIIYFPTMCI